ncbi:unconventional myosin-XV-like isoform X2 [Mizuhopecten yessoensis]|uniref:Unconventional myosin-XV n=1 Tax=Mizuhopecten yessoensis TaxID=6573 RepID=A0A210QCQ2_MIZYE|nr:unconventional myosin-XV-like isoform X2 [Mizuhopecten yessoensis]OWF46490.1 Unconventional myosin-XV [Mizuhopecten yessoensis]
MEDEQNEKGVEDMINLSVLDEGTILHNLEARYERERIYTFVGSILASVNPYKMSNIYGRDMVKKYEGQPLGSLPPHLFAIGSVSYSRMLKEKENQVVVISGESGAGKTEATKLLMQYLAAVNKSGNDLITEQILEANPLLESFGNAKTIRNDNSSRFGKYIEVFFKTGSIVGARTSEYLLEKSRLVTQAAEERNYHVFYEMLSGFNEEQKGKYGLQSANKYFYLNQGGSCSISGRDDAENFRVLNTAMEVLNFERNEQETIFKILSCVLHLGNIYFKAIQHDNGPDTVLLGSDAELKWMSHLLQLSEDWLKQALTTKVTETRGDRVLTPFNIEQALDSRDAISKALYSRLFTWLVERVNLIICRAEREKTSAIAVLDIFGFEDFHVNSFEQLCINYANETLQFFFNQHIFRLEQREYTKENIDWSLIEFQDNQPVIDLLASKPAGILVILDDECSFPQATDLSFLEKCHFHHSSNSLYDKPRMSVPEFYVIHFAGKIKYSVDHFLEKNKDTLRSDVVELLCESKNRMIASMFKEMRDRLITKTLSKSTGRYVTLKPRTPTVAAGFTESLLSLIDTMSKCNPYFVRCIKPNNHKAPMQFEKTVVLDQLRYTGMLETIRIRKMGFPIRVKFPVFIERYRFLLLGKINDRALPTEVCNQILLTQGPSMSHMYRIGATKVFMKETFEHQLDLHAKNIQYNSVVTIQKLTRMFLARRKFLHLQTATCKIQAVIKTWVERKKYLKVRNGIIKAQAQVRMRRERHRYLHAREELKRKAEQDRIARQKQEEQVKMAREEKARQAKAMEAISNLEIPGELAYIYSKLDDWQSVHTERHIGPVTDPVAHLDQKYQLPMDVDSHVFSKFANIYFRNPDWGVLKAPIKAGLTQLQGEDLNNRAVSVFKMILRYMGDPHLSKRREKAMADYIVLMGLNNEGLRDEIYCQVANQCWNNQDLTAIGRAWCLMAACLSAFPPSEKLFKYLLKFVSDVGYNGHKITCQHKALQCAKMQPQLSRSYPPCLLEWHAILQCTNMALPVKFADNVRMYGPVESWTSGEIFTSHLVSSRGLKENKFGWTVVLQEETDFYELMGYDYVLDLLSEMEIPPGFPAKPAYFLVSRDKMREPVGVVHRLYKDSPHSVDKDRFMVLMGRLPEMLKVEAPRLENRTFTPRTKENDDEKKIEFSMTSALNRRPTEIMLDGLSANSVLNLRYTKRKAPGPPPSVTSNGHNGHHVTNGLSNGHITPILEDEGADFGLAGSKLNQRYNNGLPNGTPRIQDLSSTSKLNARYTKSSAVAKRMKNGAADRISRRDHGLEKMSASSDNMSVGTGQESDWSHWVENVFNSALNEHVDTLSDARSMENRLKGGGKGVPGPGMQPPPAPPLSLPLMSNVNVLPVGGATGLGSPPSTAQGSTDTLMQQIQQQLAVQQMAQQQAQQQALVQAYLSQMNQLQAQAQVQAQAQMQNQAARQQQQQQALFQSAQQQGLQQQFLQAGLGGVNGVPGLPGLGVPNGMVPNIVSPGSSMNSVGPSPFMTPREQPVNGSVASSFSTTQMLPVAGINTTQTNVGGVPKKVYKIRTQFEGRTETNEFKPAEHIPPLITANHDKSLQITEQNSESESHKVRQMTLPTLHPPPPPAFQDQSLVSPRMPAMPPAPPPLPEIPLNGDSFNREDGTFTFTDKKGRARTVRIGRVVWPPPVEKESKSRPNVGRLEIDEGVASSIEEQVGARTQQKKPAPAPPPPPQKHEPVKSTKSLTESVHLATLQLLEQKLGAKRATPPPSPPPLPKTLPPVTPPPTQPVLVTKVIEVAPPPPPPKKEKKMNIDFSSLERVVCRLYPQGKESYLTYNSVPWSLNVRKEVFHPRERLENVDALHIIFCQVVQDVYNLGCIRIGKDERIKMRGMLENYGINRTNYQTGDFSNQVKKIVVDTAKEWGAYFSRLFPVAGQSEKGTVRYIGVSHAGIRLIDREQSMVDDNLEVLEHFKFEDVIDIVMPTKDTVQINLKDKSMVFYTNRALQLKQMIDMYLTESDKGNKYVIATKDYITGESTLLSFKRSEIIKLVDAEIPLEDGWLYGSLNGVLGYFPAEYVKPLQRHEVERSGGMKAQLTEHVVHRIIRPPSRTDGHIDNRSETSQGTVVPDGKFSMMEFALLHFRESVQKFEMERSEDGSLRGTIKHIESIKLRNLDQQNLHRRGSGEWSWKEQADMVKWTRSPIQASLLKLPTAEFNKLALECFLCVMKFMGDYPIGPNQSEYDCVLKILRSCHKHPEMRDEIYCQLCKQTTSNRSMKPKSCIMGWRLFSIIACYCDCSESIRPYLFKYLETTSSDSSRTFSGAASICLQNLRKTFKYGGRKNVPLKAEISALADGRVSKRYSFIYSGSEREGMLQVRPSLVVKDSIEEICNRLDIFDPVEMEEYTLFLRTSDDHYSRLKSEEYILDVTSEFIRGNKDYQLVFQRTVWFFPFRETDNIIYNELMFFQCLPDFLEGLLITLQSGHLSRQEEDDLPTLGALLFKAFDRVGTPTIKDLAYLLPKTMNKLSDFQPQQWVNRIHHEMNAANRLGPVNCKAKFVSILSRWPLFGSIFFMVKNAPTQPVIRGDTILAVNKNGIHFLSEATHETIIQYQFSEVMSTRRYRSDSNQNYLDMKLGNLMVQKIVRIETDQGSDISSLIGQYMQVINRHRKRPADRNSIAHRM